MDGCVPFRLKLSRRNIRLTAVWCAAALIAGGSTRAAERADVKSTTTAVRVPTTKPVPARTSTLKKLSAADLAHEIDRHVLSRLEAKKIPLSPQTSDAEFLRRAYLDIAGTIPPLEKVEPFLADKSPGKRAALIDELLRTDEYVRHMTDQWREHLIPGTAAAGRRRHETGIVWLEEAFRENRPYDEFIRGVLTVDGFQRDNGAATFLITHQSLDEVTDRMSKVLLGVQVTCAQCHDHPFAAWKQDDYWGLAAFFSKVRHQYEKIDKVEHYGVSERGERKPIMTPPSLKVVPPTYLGGVRPTLDPKEPYLPTFVDWLAADDNPYFARAFANRLWRTLMGRGLVEPVDDLRDANPGTHPELLALLGEQFRVNDFDIHYLIRAVTLSETYQRSSRPLDGNLADAELYSHMAVKVMPPYVLGDSIQVFMKIGDPPPGTETKPQAKPETKVTKSDAKSDSKSTAADPKNAEDEALKAKIRARGMRDSYASFFKGEENAAPTAFETGLPQALRLMNSQDMFRGSRVISVLEKAASDRKRLVEQVYLAALARRPSEAEQTIVANYLKTQSDYRRGLNDVIWALLNGTEFVTNH